MTYCNTVLSQMLNMLPAHAFEKLANTIDDKVRSSALSPRSQFAAPTTGPLDGRQNLPDIESWLSAQQHLHYQLATRAVSKPALARANEQCDAK